MIRFTPLFFIIVTFFKKRAYNKFVCKILSKKAFYKLTKKFFCYNMYLLINGGAPPCILQIKMHGNVLVGLKIKVYLGGYYYGKEKN